VEKRVLTIDDMLDEEKLLRMGIDTSDIKFDWRSAKSK
jgi:hypothetical protein